jgi:hypothetical protein
VARREKAPVSPNAVSRLNLASPLFNTINVRTVKIFFQKSPGKPHGDKRGIEGLPFRVQAGGSVVQTGKTPADGKIEVRLSNGAATLEILDAGQPVSTYEITVTDDDFDPASSVTGQQQRLRHLGYQLGHDGPDGDGVNAPLPPPAPPTPLPVDVDRDDDDRREIEDRKKKKKEKDLDQKVFDGLTFRTERSILDFQADMTLRVDGQVGSITRGKLVAEAGG